MSAPLHTCDVLVLDDDDILAEFVATVLERHGATATWVQDGSTGIERATAHVPDVVVSDWRMPGTNGLDVLRAVRDVNESVAFVMMSAYHTPSLRDTCIRASAGAYLQKPFRPGDLLESVEQALQSVAPPGR